MGEATDVSAANAPKPDFSSEEMERLFYWARDRVYAEITGASAPSVSALGELGERAVLGAFVSFKKRGMLRSCMGYMYDGVLLSTALDSASVSAATRDPRFPPISAAEFYDLDMEVWALGSMREIQERGESRRDAIKIGRDGIQIH
ncbi:MAG: AMMECR1 domain-containing protein, partial [Thermoguttaceae bacterium]